MADRRRAQRVQFSRGVTTYMMAIDGTWRRSCKMEDVSSTGAKLTVEGSIEGLKLTDFFLVLSSTGLAYRRCGLAWINGGQLGVSFMRQTSKKNAANL
ncbi:MAG TPA: PilZ domain-containing protein [Bradyrhizobium sp.]|nr:PilZ domain-containing protein [Bradyrhizobium sp.]